MLKAEDFFSFSGSYIKFTQFMLTTSFSDDNDDEIIYLYKQSLFEAIKSNGIVSYFQC